MRRPRRSSQCRAPSAGLLALVLLLPSCASDGEPPPEYRQRYAQGSDQFRMENFAAAKDTFQRLLHDYPDEPFNEVVKLRLATCESLLGNLEPARQAYRELIDHLNDRQLKAQALDSLGMLEFNAGNYASATSYFGQAEALADDAPSKALYRYRAARSMQRSGRFSAAREIFSELAASAASERVARDAADCLQYPDYFTVQVGSYGRRENADKLREDLERAGYRSEIKEFKSGARVLYRVWAGRSPDFKAAEAARERLLHSNVLPADAKPLVIP
jgi:tetratricopeptide (TPR) repeat protein